MSFWIPQPADWGLFWTAKPQRRNETYCIEYRSAKLHFLKGLRMRGNIPISELNYGEEVWLTVVVTAVRERRTQQGKLYYEAQARNASGSISLRIWNEAIEIWKEIRPGLWGITGHLESSQDRPQFVVAEYRPISVEQYREHQHLDPILPRAYTMDIETIPLPDYRERIGPHLE